MLNVNSKTDLYYDFYLRSAFLSSWQQISLSESNPRMEEFHLGLSNSTFIIFSVNCKTLLKFTLETELVSSAMFTCFFEGGGILSRNSRFSRAGEFLTRFPRSSQMGHVILVPRASFLSLGSRRGARAKLFSLFDSLATSSSLIHSQILKRFVSVTTDNYVIFEICFGRKWHLPISYPF